MTKLQYSISLLNTLLEISVIPSKFKYLFSKKFAKLMIRGDPYQIVTIFQVYKMNLFFSFFVEITILDIYIKYSTRNKYYPFEIQIFIFKKIWKTMIFDLSEHLQSSKLQNPSSPTPTPPPSHLINFPFPSVMQGSFEIHRGCIILVRPFLHSISLKKKKVSNSNFISIFIL